MNIDGSLLKIAFLKYQYKSLNTCVYDKNKTAHVYHSIELCIGLKASCCLFLWVSQWKSVCVCVCSLFTKLWNILTVNQMLSKLYLLFHSSLSYLITNIYRLMRFGLIYIYRKQRIKFGNRAMTLVHRPHLWIYSTDKNNNNKKFYLP